MLFPGLSRDKDSRTRDAMAALTGAGAAYAIPNIAATGLSFYSPEAPAEYVSKVSPREAEMLKRRLLHTAQRDMPIRVVKGFNNAAFIAKPKDYMPSTRDLSKALDGVRLLGGDKIPASQFIENVRKSGGEVVLGSKHRDIATLAHELGHASMTNPGASKLRTDPVISMLRRMGRTKSPQLAALGTLATMGIDSDSPYLYAPAAAVAATQLPLIAEEGTATAKGLMALKNLERSKDISAGTTRYALKNLGKYFGQYGLVGAGAVGAPLLAAYLKDKD